MIFRTTQKYTHSLGIFILCESWDSQDFGCFQETAQRSLVNIYFSVVYEFDEGVQIRICHILKHYNRVLARCGLKNDGKFGKCPKKERKRLKKDRKWIEIFTFKISRKYGLQADRTTLWALRIFPSHANVTSTKSSSSLRFSKADVRLLW